jgi:hypothetical protein
MSPPEKAPPPASAGPAAREYGVARAIEMRHLGRAVAQAAGHSPCRRPSASTWCSSALNIAVFHILVAFVEIVMPASHAAIPTFTMPLWTALFAWIWLGEPADRTRAPVLGSGAAAFLRSALLQCSEPQSRGPSAPSG